MCSILTNIIKKDLTSIVRSYLMKNTEKIILNVNEPTEFVNKYFLIKMKRRFPQSHYGKINTAYNSYIKFNLEPISIDEFLMIKMYDPLFNKNKLIDNFVSFKFSSLTIKFYTLPGYW